MILCQTKRLIIRHYEEADIPQILSVINKNGIYRTTYGIPRKSDEARIRWWIDYLSASEKHKIGYEYGMFLKHTGEYIGNIGIANINKLHNRGEITYFISPKYWNKGFATEGGRAILAFGFEDLKLKKVAGACMSINPASRRVMEKLGFIYEGTSRCELLKDRKYYDIDRLSILDNEYRKIAKKKYKKRFST